MSWATPLRKDHSLSGHGLTQLRITGPDDTGGVGGVFAAKVALPRRARATLGLRSTIESTRHRSTVSALMTRRSLPGRADALHHHLASLGLPMIVDTCTMEPCARRSRDAATGRSPSITAQVSARIAGIDSTMPPGRNRPRGGGDLDDGRL